MAKVLVRARDTAHVETRPPMTSGAQIGVIVGLTVLLKIVIHCLNDKNYFLFPDLVPVTGLMSL